MRSWKNAHLTLKKTDYVYGYKYPCVSYCCKDRVSTDVTLQGAIKSLQRLRASSIALYRDHSGNFKSSNNNVPGNISESRVEDTNQEQSWKSLNRVET